LKEEKGDVVTKSDEILNRGRYGRLVEQKSREGDGTNHVEVEQDEESREKDEARQDCSYECEDNDLKVDRLVDSKIRVESEGEEVRNRE